MKVQVKEEEKKFKPIVLEITIESEEELCNLWHRVNARSKVFSGYAGIDKLKHPINSELYDLFRSVDSLVENHNLRK